MSTSNILVYGSPNESERLCRLVSDFRVQNGVRPIELSAAMTYVAEQHLENLITNRHNVFNLTCNMHSWYPNASFGLSNFCCYPPPFGGEDCMGPKGIQLTSHWPRPYLGRTIENSWAARISGTSPDASTDPVMQSFIGWQKSPGHRRAMLSGPNFACGYALRQITTGQFPFVNIHQYANLWLGTKSDPNVFPTIAPPPPLPDRPTPEPTLVPTLEPTPVPTLEPTPVPTLEPTPVPTLESTLVPTLEPTPVPTLEPTPVPTLEPTSVPTLEPTPVPTLEPTPVPTLEPTPVPTLEPTLEPTPVPTLVPTLESTSVPTLVPTSVPTLEPTLVPTLEPTLEPTVAPIPTEPTFGPPPTNFTVPTPGPTSLDPGAAGVVVIFVVVIIAVFICIAVFTGCYYQLQKQPPASTLIQPVGPNLEAGFAKEDNYYQVETVDTQSVTTARSLGTRPPKVIHVSRNQQLRQEIEMNEMLKLAKRSHSKQ